MDLYNELMEYKEMVAPAYVCNASVSLTKPLKEGKEILLLKDSLEH